MTIGDILYRQIAIRTGRDLSLLDIDIILSHVLKKPKEFLYSHPEYTLTQPQQKTFLQLAKQRLAGEPIAYLLGNKEFFDLNFVVNKDVLIPRPDTELLVEEVLKYLDKSPTKTKPVIADIGTGSGNIAISIKKHFPNCTMLATDISKPALNVAKRNAQANKTSIQFYQGNVLAALPKKFTHSLDVITFNAPYLTKTEARKKNLAYEPQVALTPIGKPTELIEILLQQASTYLNTHGVLFFEIGHRQGQQVKKLCGKYFPKAKVTIKQDLGKFDRVVKCFV